MVISGKDLAQVLPTKGSANPTEVPWHLINWRSTITKSDGMWQNQWWARLHASARHRRCRVKSWKVWDAEMMGTANRVYGRGTEENTWKSSGCLIQAIMSENETRKPRDALTTWQSYVQNEKYQQCWPGNSPTVIDMALHGKNNSESLE